MRNGGGGVKVGRGKETGWAVYIGTGKATRCSEGGGSWGKVADRAGAGQDDMRNRGLRGYGERRKRVTAACVSVCPNQTTERETLLVPATFSLLLTVPIRHSNWSVSWPVAAAPSDSGPTWLLGFGGWAWRTAPSLWITRRCTHERRALLYYTLLSSGSVRVRGLGVDGCFDQCTGSRIKIAMD